VFGSFVGVSSKFTGVQWFLHSCFAIADDLMGQNFLIEIFWSDQFFPNKKKIFFSAKISLFIHCSVLSHICEQCRTRAGRPYAGKKELTRERERERER